MGNERAFELMNLALDGQATPSEQVELRGALEGSQEARSTYEELRELNAELEWYGSLSVSAQGVKDAVMQQLHRRVESSHKPSSSVIAFSSRPRRVLAWAWGVAAAAILVIALYPVFTQRSGPSLSQFDARGSMTPSGTSGWPRVSEVTSIEANRQVTLVVRRSGDRFALDIEVSGERNAPISVQWNPRQLKVLAFPDVAGDTSRTRETGSITYPAEAPGRATFVFSRVVTSGSSEVVVSVAGKELLRTSVLLDDINRR